MIISDLDYLENVEGSVEGGSYYYPGKNFKFDKKVKTNVKHRLDIKKRINSKVYVKGINSHAEAYADAYGKDAMAETLTVNHADGYNASAYSEGTAATNGSKWY